MKITSIELTNQELDQITKYLTDKFNEIETSKQNIEGQLDALLCNEIVVKNLIDFESELELYIEYAEFDENHQTSIISRSALKFRITFFYDGEEITVNFDKIYTDIENYYSI